MEKTIFIEGKPIKMKVTARIHAEYREAFGRDLLRDMNKFSEDDEISIEFIEKLAWLMAKKAGNQVHPPEKTAEEAVNEWLDTFNKGTAILKASKQIMGLYNASESGHSKPRKK